MKRIHFVKLLFIALLSCSSLFVWSAEETITFTNKDWAPWTNVTSGSSFESTGSARGVANNGVNGCCTSISSYSNVSKIVVIASSNTTGGKVAIKIGDTQIANKLISNSNNATYTYDANDYSNISTLSGKITLSVTKPSSKTVYVKSITITYSSSGSTETTPSITQQPKDATYDQGATPAALTITASGNPTPAYQWYSNTSKRNSNGTKISGATEASYTPSTDTAGTFYYYCVATNSQGSASSDVATIKVNTVTTYTVLWSLGGEEYTEGDPTTSVKSGEQVSTLPTAPNGDAIGSCANTFMGWSTHDLGTKKGQSAPTDLFTTAEGSPVITQDTIFYAVFATDPTK